MKIKVCTLGFGECASYYQLSSDNKKAYCERMGYDFVTSDKPIGTRTWTWSKIAMLLRELKDCDFIVWFDIDTWIFNDIDIESILDNQHVMFISSDGRLNTGVFALRNCKEAVDLLMEWYNDYEFDGHIWAESKVFWKLEKQMPEGFFKIIDKDFWNSYLPKKEGTNVIHLVGETEGARSEYFKRCQDGRIK